MTTERARRGRGRPPHPDILTPREWQVLDLLRERLTNEHIAQRLDISLAGAKYHVSEILTKLGLPSREEAAAWQPEAVPVRWWQRALAWLQRRAWPLAGAAGAVAALAAVGLLAWALWQSGSEETGEGAAAQATARPSLAPRPSPSPAPGSDPVIVNRPLGRVLQPVDPSAPITEQGALLLEISTGLLWRLNGSGVMSPDGSRVATVQGSLRGGSLDIVDLASGTATRVVETGVADVSWSPGGGLVFSYSSPDLPSCAPPCWSPAPNEWPAAVRTYLLNADGTGLRKLPEDVHPSAQWSHTGKYVARVTYPMLPDGQAGELNIMDLETGARDTPVVQARDDPLSYAWSPVDDRLAYATKDGLFFYDPATTQSTPFITGRTAGAIVWSPDASKILAPYGEPVPASGGRFSVQMMHVFDLTGQVPPVELPPGYARWSPDSSLLAYQDDGCVTGEWDINTIAPDGTGLTRLTATPDQFKEGPHWSPDGSTLAFATPGELTLLDVRSTETTVVATTNYDAGNGQILHLHQNPWSAGGRYLHFGAGGAHGVCD